jgi:hypothetical protein
MVVMKKLSQIAARIKYRGLRRRPPNEVIADKAGKIVRAYNGKRRRKLFF